MTRKGRSAIEEAHSTLDTNLRLMGKEHPETSTSMSTLAEAYRHSGDLVSARTFDEEVLHIRRRLGGDENYFTLRAEHDLAMTLFDSTDYSMAMELQLHVLECLKRQYGDESNVTEIAKVNPAITLFKLGDFHELEGLQEQILARRSEELGDGDPSTRPAFVALIKTKHTLGKREYGIRQEKLWLKGATRRLRGKFRGTSEEELD